MGGEHKSIGFVEITSIFVMQVTFSLCMVSLKHGAVLMSISFADSSDSVCQYMEAKSASDTDANSDREICRAVLQLAN